MGGALRVLEQADYATAAEVLDQARTMHIAMTKVQARGVFLGVQSMFDQVQMLVQKSGLDPASANALMAGQGRTPRPR